MTGGLSISQQLIKAVKAKQDYSEIAETLSQIKKEELINRLSSDNAKKAFWLNIYNAFNIIMLANDPKVILNRISRKIHFTKKEINIVGYWLSLDDIEHGMIRNSKVWWSKGYLRKPFVSDLEKKLRVKSLDPRIHFALNCGAESCPAIRFYTDETVNEQLDLATRTFLQNEVEYDSYSHTLRLSQLFNWYMGDFGGKKGIRDFLRQYRIDTPSNTKFEFSNYSWEPMLEAFG